MINLTGFIRLVLCLSAPLLAQVQMLESLRQTTFSRWDFQERFPGSKRLFTNSLSPSELPKLISQVRQAHPTALTTSEAPTFADLWANFTVGLALEKTKVGSGESELVAATQLAKGNIAVNFELARILTETGLYQRARLLHLEVQRTMLEKGFIKIPELAKLELLRSRQAMGRGLYLAARQEAEFAGRLDPLCPWVPFLLMEMEFREKPPLNWDLSAAWGRLSEAVRLLRYYDSQSLFLINMSRAIRMGLAFFGAIAIFVLFGKYFTRITHLWVEKLPNQVEIRIRYFALAFLPLSLLIGGLGYAALGLVFTMLLWKHVSNQEKTFLKVVMTGLAIIPFILMWEHSMGRHLDDALGVNLYHRAYIRGYEVPLQTRLDTFKPKTPEDSLFRNLAYSITYKKQGNYVKAGEFGSLASEADPDDPYVLLNSGNLAMVGFEYPSASTAYAQARRVAPNMVETWFNSSQAELYSNNSTEHKKFLDRAAEADPQWVNQFLNDNDEYFPQYPATRKAMDPMLRNRMAWVAAWNSMVNMDFLTVPMRMGIYEILGGWLITLVTLISLLLYFRFRHYSQHSHGKDLFDCKICNRVMCRLCRKGVHCQTCFKTVSGIHENRVKMEMVKRMRLRATVQRVRTGAILNSLWPGAGLLFLGLGTGRFVWILATGFLMGGLWQINHLLMEYPAFVIGPLSWLPWLPIAVLYLMFNIKLLRAPINIGELMAASTSPEKEVFR